MRRISPLQWVAVTIYHVEVDCVAHRAQRSTNSDHYRLFLCDTISPRALLQQRKCCGIFSCILISKKFLRRQKSTGNLRRTPSSKLKGLRVSELDTFCRRKRAESTLHRKIFWDFVLSDQSLARDKASKIAKILNYSRAYGWRIVAGDFNVSLRTTNDALWRNNIRTRSIYAVPAARPHQHQLSNPIIPSMTRQRVGCYCFSAVQFCFSFPHCFALHWFVGCFFYARTFRRRKIAAIRGHWKHRESRSCSFPTRYIGALLQLYRVKSPPRPSHILRSIPFDVVVIVKRRLRQGNSISLNSSAPSLKTS